MKTKKVLASIVTGSLLTLLLSSRTTALTDSVNLIQNANFENGFTNWVASKGGELSTSVSYDEGTGSGVLTPAAVNNYYPNNPFADGFVGQIVTVKPGTDYKLEAYVKTDTAGAKGILAVKSGKTNKEIVSQPVTSTEWKKQTLYFNSGDNTQVAVRLEKYTYGITAKSNIYIDNVSLVEEAPKTYNEVWRDDFNASELNLNDWGYELGSIRGIEQQHYVNNKENVFLEGGDLVLKATDRPVDQQYPNPRNNTRHVIYNSGSVRTHGKHEFLYGKLEIRAKLPKGQGVFPAFWTLGSDFRLDGKIAGDQGHGWPSTGEIDIMELTGDATSGSYNNRTVYQTLHYGAANDDNGKYAGHGTAYSLASGNFNDDYHTFAIDWSKDTISWLVDGKVVRTVDYSDDSIATAILNKPQYAQLNLAMGGAWPGAVGTDLAGTEFRIDYLSYSRTEEQEKQAAEYYASAPQLEGVKDVTITQGQVPNLLEGVTTSEGYKADYSIDTEYTFKDEGGNSNVDLVVAGDAQKEKIAQLKPGKYNIHYSAVPVSGITTDSKIARKTVVLTVVENTKPTEPSSSSSSSSSDTSASSSSSSSDTSTSSSSSSSDTSASSSSSSSDTSTSSSSGSSDTSTSSSSSSSDTNTSSSSDSSDTSTRLSEGLYTDEATGVSVQLTGQDAKEKLTLVVNPVNSDELKGKSAALDALKYDAFDIHFENDGEVYQLTSEATLGLPISENKKVTDVLYLSPSDKAITQESLKFDIKDGKAFVKVSHFSIYALVYNEEVSVNSTQTPSKVLPSTGDTMNVYLIIAGAILLMATGFIMVHKITVK